MSVTIRTLDVGVFAGSQRAALAIEELVPNLLEIVFTSKDSDLREAIRRLGLASYNKNIFKVKELKLTGEIKENYSFLVDVEGIFGERSNAISNKAKEILFNDALDIERLDSLEKDKKLSVYFLAVLAILQNEFPFFNKEKYKKLVIKILLSSRFIEGDDFADEHFTVEI